MKLGITNVKKEKQMRGRIERNGGYIQRQRERSREIDETRMFVTECQPAPFHEISAESACMKMPCSVI